MKSATGQDLVSGECTGVVLRAFFDVYNRLGHGLAEVAYEQEMVLELSRRGHNVKSQRCIGDRYGTRRRGQFRPDLIVNQSVLVEIKARSRILKRHWAQLLNYLRLSGIQVGLVLNFGPRPEFKRLVLSRRGGGRG